MSPHVSQNLFPLPLPSLNSKDEEKLSNGIVWILDSQIGASKFASLRRTLSEDMSSKKWLNNNGLFSDAPLIPDSDGGDDFGIQNGISESQIWSSVESEKKEAAGQLDVWSSILAKKSEEQAIIPPPYVHPLVRRTASSLSEKSLEICTESLGSETGSDCFSTYPSSETGDAVDDGEGLYLNLQRQKQQQQEEKEIPYQFFERDEFEMIKYNNSYSGKKSPPRSFPPPLPSRSHGSDGGTSVQMQSYRKAGRLVLEAVSIPQKNYFQAQRNNGRLLLTMVHDTSYEEIDDEENEDDEVEEFKQMFDKIVNERTENDEDDEEEIDRDKFDKRENGKEFSMERVKGSTLTMTKLIPLNNRNTRCPNNFNKPVKLEEEDEEQPPNQSLPRVVRLMSSPLATAAAAASINGYEYFWRTKPSSVTSICYPFPQKSNNKALVDLTNSTKKNIYKKKELKVMRGRNNNNNNNYNRKKKEEFLVPLLKSCSKDSRKSLLIWEPCYCVPTS